MNPHDANSSRPPHSKRKTARPPFSRLAVAAIILAAVPCCPLINLLGAAIGVAAWRRVLNSRGTLRGGRLAAWAVFVGSAVSLLSSLALTGLQSAVNDANHEVMIGQVSMAINAAIDGDAARVRRVWTRSPMLTDEAIASFGSTIRERYGKVIRVTISSEAITGSLFQPQYAIACIVVFERAELLGSAEFQVKTMTGGLWPEFQIRSLVIEDPDGGNLALPPADALPPPSESTIGDGATE